MKIILGLKAAFETLCNNRRLDLEYIPDNIQSKIIDTFGKKLSPIQVVNIILDEVRTKGDHSVRDFTTKFDGVNLESLEVSSKAIAEAYSELNPKLVDALHLAKDRILEFHSAYLPKSWMDFSKGYGLIVKPVNRVGAYIPANLSSTVLMTVIPAKVAGVNEIIVTTPSKSNGTPNPAVLVAADIAGADKVFFGGGAQAISAMSFGTQTIPKVDMICGPGNIFVTLAKKMVFGEVGVDGLYGPTETVIIADEHANPTLCATDLLAQSEHDVMATPILITTSQNIADIVQKEVKERSVLLERAKISIESINRNGHIVIVNNLEDAITLSNEFAPEHLSLMVKDPWNYVGKIRNVGTLFLGEQSYEVLGDYVAGPSHVMPTGGTARFGSGLGIWSFLKVSPIIALDNNSASSLTDAAALIARSEGLTAHAEAAEIRKEL